MGQRFYSFKMPDGREQLMTLKEALDLNEPLINERIRQIVSNSKVKRMSKDGFTPGWQENICEYAGGRKEYDRILKEKGLVEIGYDYVPKESTRVTNPCANLDFALHAKSIGVDLSDREVEAIASGDFFESAKCDLGPEVSA